MQPKNSKEAKDISYIALDNEINVLYSLYSNLKQKKTELKEKLKKKTNSSGDSSNSGNETDVLKASINELTNDLADKLKLLHNKFFKDNTLDWLYNILKKNYKGVKEEKLRDINKLDKKHFEMLDICKEKLAIKEIPWWKKMPINLLSRPDLFTYCSSSNLKNMIKQLIDIPNYEDLKKIIGSDALDKMKSSKEFKNAKKDFAKWLGKDLTDESVEKYTAFYCACKSYQKGEMSVAQKALFEPYLKAIKDNLAKKQKEGENNYSYTKKIILAISGAATVIVGVLLGTSGLGQILSCLTAIPNGMFMATFMQIGVQNMLLSMIGLLAISITLSVTAAAAIKMFVNLWKNIKQERAKKLVKGDKQKTKEAEKAIDIKTIPIVQSKDSEVSNSEELSKENHNQSFSILKTSSIDTMDNSIIDKESPELKNKKQTSMQLIGLENESKTKENVPTSKEDMIINQNESQKSKILKTNTIPLKSNPKRKIINKNPTLRKNIINIKERLKPSSAGNKGQDGKNSLPEKEDILDINQLKSQLQTIIDRANQNINQIDQKSMKTSIIKETAKNSLETSFNETSGSMGNRTIKLLKSRNMKQESLNK